MDSEVWLIGLSNTLHLLATVVWIGWSALLPLVVAPRIPEAHSDDKNWVATMTRRVPPVAYGGLAMLLATGMIQMGAHPEYEGMFALSNLWSSLLFAKHVVVLCSILLIAFLSQFVSPKLRLALRRQALGKSNTLGPLVGQFRLLAWLNFVAGVVVLAITGLMTAIR